MQVRLQRQGVGGATMALVLLLSAAQAGLFVPGEESLRGHGAGSALDYAGLPGTVSPLTDDFVAQALGFTPLGVGTPTREPSRPGPVTVAGGVGQDQEVGTGVVAHAPTNDAFRDAYPVGEVPFSARTDASRAGRERGEPTDCAPTGATVWYRYRPAHPVGLAASAIGDGPVSLAVFAGDGLGDLEQVRCHNGLRGSAQLSLDAQADTAYWFQVTMTGGGGSLAFHLDPLGTTTRVSVSSSGEPARYAPYPSGSFDAAISRDGRYVVFQSDAGNLVDEDDNDATDVFVHDRRTGTTELVSKATDGTQGDGSSGGMVHAISDDGRFVAFYSTATNLVDGDNNGWTDVFVHDRVTGQTERVSVSSTGVEGRAPDDPVNRSAERLNECDCGSTLHRGVDISADGRFVAFESELVGLVDGDEDAEAEGRGTDVFVHDRQTGVTTMVSVSSDGEYADDWSDFPSMSADGRWIAFRSFATNLRQDAGPPRVGASLAQVGDSQVYVHDRSTGVTRVVSVTPDGQAADDDSWGPSITADGRFVAFASWADDLVPGDHNEFLDVFVRDLQEGVVDLVSVSSSGDAQAAQQADTNRLLMGQILPDISDDGRYVVFESEDPTLDPSDDNGVVDIFVRDRHRGTTTRVSVSSDGEQAAGYSQSPVISGDGRHVAFASVADNLVDGDSNGDGAVTGSDVFVHTLGITHA